MLSKQQAAASVAEEVDGCVVKACVPYKGGYLARVEMPSEEEKHFDPFFVVNANTGEVQAFNIMTDADDLDEVAEAFKNG
jgi:hypothetical protein